MDFVKWNIIFQLTSMKNLKIIDKIVLIIVGVISLTIIGMLIIDNWAIIPEILGNIIYILYMIYFLLHLGLLLPSLYIYQSTMIYLEEKYPEAREYSDGLFEAIAWILVILPHIVLPTLANMLISGSWDILDNLTLFKANC